MMRKGKRFLSGLGLAAGVILFATHVFAYELELDVSPEVTLTYVKPKLVPIKGSDKGRMVVEVAIKNIGAKPVQFVVFASAREEGGWATGRIFLPKEGLLKPQETAKGEVSTDYQGKELPSLIKIESYEKAF